MKKYIRHFIIFILLITFIVIASAGNAAAEQTTSDNQTNSDTNTADVESKEEVIYATLNQSGKISEIYAVNILNIQNGGVINDYGSYSKLKNLTNTKTLTYNDNTVTTTASEGRFYYQGTLTEEVLPWTITVTYYLNGKEISPEQLAGSKGNVEIKITTNKNNKAVTQFFENYLLQVQLTLDTSKCFNIEAKGGAIANAGSDKVITFTVMPNTEGNIIVNADTVDFEMDSISLSAVPFAMNIELPDTSQISGGLTSLSEAVTQFNDGVKDLETGAKSMKDGAITLKDGSADFKYGFDTLKSNAKELKDASKTILEALQFINTSISTYNINDITELTALPAGLEQLANGLDSISLGMSELGSGYSAAYDALKKAIEEIPEDGIPEADLQELMKNNPDSLALKQLLANYTGARTVKETYNSVSEAFEAVKTNLPAFTESLDTMSKSLKSTKEEISTSVANIDTSSISALSTGLSSLAENYSDFHDGLEDYINGVIKLNGAYSKVHTGIVSLSDGTGELTDGIEKLAEGSDELDRETKNIPEQMETTMDSLINEYDKTDFTPVSFISDKNKNVKSVQFIMKTQKIEIPEPELKDTTENEPETFWTRLKDLFH